MSVVELRAVDGSNPVGLLTALGTLSLATRALPPPVRLHWTRAPTGWFPVITGAPDLDADGLVTALDEAHAARDLDAELGWENDIMSLTREDVRTLIAGRLSAEDAEAAAMVAACVAELPLRPPAEELVAYTPFRLIPRVGRARFLATARGLSEPNDVPAALRHALLGPARYARANNLRWDPGAKAPVRAYAGEAPTNFGPLAIPGTMLLAVSALRYFPLVADGHGRAACRGFGVDRTRLVWPLWSEPLSEPATRVLLGLPELYAEQPDPQVLSRYGVVARLVAERERLGGDVEMLSWGEPRELSGGGLGR